MTGFKQTVKEIYQDFKEMIFKKKKPEEKEKKEKKDAAKKRKV